MTQEKKLETIVKALDSKRAEDITVIGIRDLTIIADYFVIADGTSSTQVKALADEVEFRMKNDAGLDTIEGLTSNTAAWTILDYGDIAVHIFHKDQREFYSLERLWNDGEIVDISSWINTEG